MCKSINHSTEGRTFFIFPLVYVRRAPTLTLVALVWFFHPYAAMFMRAQHTDSQTTNTWLFPVFWMKRAPGHAETAFVFLFHPRASVVYRLRKDAQTLIHVLILYWHRVTEHINDYGITFVSLSPFPPPSPYLLILSCPPPSPLCISPSLHPPYFIIYSYVIICRTYLVILLPSDTHLLAQEQSKRPRQIVSLSFSLRPLPPPFCYSYSLLVLFLILPSYFWPIVYVQQKESRSYCLLYFYPPKIAFISSSGTGNVTIWLVSLFFCSLYVCSCMFVVCMFVVCQRE